MIEWITDLGTSDVCAGWPGGISYAWRQLGHAAIGGIVVLLPPLARWAFLTAWLAKEMFLDALGCDLSPWVAADSVADILCAVIGFLLVSKLRQERLRYE